jgi:hypothetical protein
MKAKVNKASSLMGVFQKAYLKEKESTDFKVQR